MELQQEIIIQSNYEEIEKVEGFLNDLQKELQFDDELYAKLMLVVSEAVTNGIVHGNKLDSEKKVHLKAYTNSNRSRLIFESTDEGPGFDPDKVPDPLAHENLLKSSGRGVYLMREYADSVEYSENGKRITLQFLL